jgi:hypothetical protein
MDDEGQVVFEKLISENIDKHYQVMLTVNEFKGEHYLGLRKYFLSFDEGFIPSREGISMKYEIDSSFRLLEGLLEIIPVEEARPLLEKYLAT